VETKEIPTVLLYAALDSGERLERVVTGLVPQEKLHVYRTIRELSEGLRVPMEQAPIAVILAATADELSMIVSLSYLLDDVRSILILPDRQEPTVAIGHSLRPRFLSYKDSDFAAVAAVLTRMMEGPCIDAPPRCQGTG